MIMESRLLRPRRLDLSRGRRLRAVTRADSARPTGLGEAYFSELLADGHRMRARIQPNSKCSRTRSGEDPAHARRNHLKLRPEIWDHEPRTATPMGLTSTPTTSRNSSLAVATDELWLTLQNEPAARAAALNAPGGTVFWIGALLSRFFRTLLYLLSVLYTRSPFSCSRMIRILSHVDFSVVYLFVLPCLACCRLSCLLPSVLLRSCGALLL